MPLFECHVTRGPYEWHKNIFAATASKARYQYWLEVSDANYDIPYIDIRSRKSRGYTDEDIKRFKTLAEYRGITFAYLGMKVKFNNRDGEIVGVTESACIDVYFYDEQRTGGCHPHNKMQYFDKQGNCLYDSELELKKEKNS